MATNFPVPPVDRLPIFADEACSAAILMDMVGGGVRAMDESGDGSRWGMEEAGNSSVAECQGERGEGPSSGPPYGEQVFMQDPGA